MRQFLNSVVVEPNEITISGPKVVLAQHVTSEISVRFPLLLRSGAPDTIRTCGLHLRRVALYPAELRVHLNFA